MTGNIKRASSQEHLQGDALIEAVVEEPYEGHLSGEKERDKKEKETYRIFNV